RAAADLPLADAERPGGRGDRPGGGDLGVSVDRPGRPEGGDGPGPIAPPAGEPDRRLPRLPGRLPRRAGRPRRLARPRPQVPPTPGAGLTESWVGLDSEALREAN